MCTRIWSSSSANHVFAFSKVAESRCQCIAQVISWLHKVALLNKVSVYCTGLARLCLFVSHLPGRRVLNKTRLFDECSCVCMHLLPNVWWCSSGCRFCVYLSMSFPGSKIQDQWAMILDPGIWTVDPGAWIPVLDPGIWVVNQGFWILDPRAWILDPTCWNPDLEIPSSLWFN